MFKGFRDFLMRGNVVDLAVAVIIGTAFSAITKSLVEDIFTPLLAALIGKPNFGALVLELHGAKITYGNFLNAAINFMLVATVVYFCIVLPIHALTAKLHKEGPPVPPTTKTCPECLSSIPLAARRCSFCTQPVEGVKSNSPEAGAGV